ncbi:MAG: sn-glycerol-1-phosphate dehydrogenase [Ruminococcaceae bacterium]|nr:sn-glycerol-1-phosphate dehydrogenase [Oscillospiraceae bacterium]
MEIKELLLGREVCECGKSHKCPIDYVIISENAFDSIPEIIAEYKRILLVADRNTYAACGDAVKEKLDCRLADTLVYATNDVLVPNEVALDELRSHVTENTDLIIGIGSGVINDLCKQVSFEHKLPYYIVATAPSMDGYASKGSALILEGMKVTLNADVPKAIIADVNVLKNAPFDMIQSGYGDIIGKYSCLNDWKLASVVNGEYLCEYVMDATYEAVEKTVRLADGLVERDGDAIKALMEALVAVGILMAYVGNSRPASGSEHHMSHYFEIVGIVRGEKYFPHGIDVCYSAIDTAKIREELLDITDISNFESHFDKAKYEREVARIYTDIKDEVLALQDKLGWYGIDRVSVYKEKWEKIREVLASCPSSAEMLSLVEKIGLSYADFIKLYGEDKITDAHFYAKDLKDRYSVLWMYYDLMA